MTRYMLQRGHLPLSVRHGARDYRVAFDKAMTARTVLNGIHPAGAAAGHLLLRGDRISVARWDVSLNMEVDASLFLKKATRPGGPLDPMNDAGYHVATIRSEELYAALVAERTVQGLVIPYSLVMEDEEEFVFRCQIVEWEGPTQRPPPSPSRPPPLPRSR